MSEERRNRILEACRKLMLKYGYDKMTVSDIAAEAGISKGAVYLHFKSKQAVAEALIWHEMADVQADLAARLNADPEGGSFVSLYLHGLRSVAERPLLRAFYANRKAVLGDLIRTLAPSFANASSRQLATEFVAKYQALGLIRPELDPKTVAFILAFMRYGLLTIDEVMPHDDIPDMDGVLTMLADVLDRGFGTKGGDTSSGRQAWADYVQAAIEKGLSGLEDGEK